MDERQEIAIRSRGVRYQKSIESRGDVDGAPMVSIAIGADSGYHIPTLEWGRS